VVDVVVVDVVVVDVVVVDVVEVVVDVEVLGDVLPGAGDEVVDVVEAV